MPDSARPPGAPASASPPQVPPILDAPLQRRSDRGPHTARIQGPTASQEQPPILGAATLQPELEPRLTRRLPVLAALLVLAHVWIQQHLDLSLWKEVLALAGIGALMPLLRWVWKLVRPNYERDLRSAVIAVARFLLASGTLTLLTLSIVVPGTMLSSVTLISAGAPGPLGYRLHPEGSAGGEATGFPKGQQLDGPASVQRVLAWTRPLGSAYVLEVEGYRRHSFDLYPWSGARIRVAEDLKRLPAVLVRVPSGVQALLESGRIELHELEEGVRGAMVAAADTDPSRGAALFGPPLEVPTAVVDSWKRSLEADGIDGPARARSLAVWERPVPARLTRPLNVHSELEATFIARSGSLRARARLRIGEETLIDVLLEPENVP